MMRPVKSWFIRDVARGLTRRTMAFSAPYRSAPSRFLARMWAGLTRNTPAFTGSVRPLGSAASGSVGATDISNIPPEVEAARILTARFAETDRARAIIHDSQYSLALSLSLSRSLGIDLALAHQEALGLPRLLKLSPDRDIAREFALDHSLAQALTIGLDLARTRDIDVKRAANLEAELQSSLEHASRIARDLTAHLVKDLGLDGERATALHKALNYYLCRALTTDRGRDLALVRDIAQARVSSLDRARALASDRFIYRTFLAHRAIIGSRSRALALAGGLARNLQGADLRGADLSGADLSDADLRGVLWSNSTSWPPEMTLEVKERSVEVEPGVFRIEDDRGRSRIGDLSCVF